nr:immunoglobulin heavy chain junction region [Mus musculus]MBK4195122.1 immunoglobulin heavy chain junction region [Mus musculus]
CARSWRLRQSSYYAMDYW